MAIKHIENVAIVGAGGQLGSMILSHLLATNKFNVTIISRQSSSNTFPDQPRLRVQKGDYEDPTFLKTAFSGQQAAIFTLSFMAMGAQPALIDAAAKAGVRWILPTEFGADPLAPRMYEGVGFLASKAAARKQIEESGGNAKWIAITTNPWTDFSIQMGVLGLDPWKKTARIATDGGKFVLTTLEQVGRGVASVLSLPIEGHGNGEVGIERYENNFVYLSSFVTSQEQLLESMKRVTKTEDSQWKIEHFSNEERISKDLANIAGGDANAQYQAMGDLLFAYYVSSGRGSDFQHKAVKDLEVLGLAGESEDEIVARAFKAGPKSFTG